MYSDCVVARVILRMKETHCRSRIFLAKMLQITGLFSKSNSVFSDCDVSEMFTLRNGNELMLHKIQDMLDPNPPLKKNWRQVGHHLNVTEGDLDLLELQYKSNGSPTESLIETLKNFTPEPSMKKFVEALISCERSDVAKYICNWPWEKRNCTELENHEQPDTVQQPS